MRKKRHREIDPDEIFIDSANAGEFDRDQFEGRIERPLGRRSFIAAGVLAGRGGAAFSSRPRGRGGRGVCFGGRGGEFADYKRRRVRKTGAGKPVGAKGDFCGPRRHR